MKKVNKKKLSETIRGIIKEELKENPSVDVVKNLSQNYVALKRAMDDPSYPSTAHTKAALIKIENKIKEMCQNEKIKQMFMNTIPRALVNILKENQPQTSPSTAPSKPNIQPGIKPGTPGTDKPKPRRPLGNPNVQPKPKASIKEEEMLNKIVARFKSKKTNEGINYPGDNKWQEGYKTGYGEGFNDCKLGKKNKFLKENWDEQAKEQSGEKFELFDTNDQNIITSGNKIQLINWLWKKLVTDGFGGYEINPINTSK